MWEVSTAPRLLQAICAMCTLKPCIMCVVFIDQIRGARIGAVMFKTKVYVVGGAAERGKAGKTKLPSNLHRTIEAFDIESGTWSDVAEIPEQHGGVAWPAVVGDPSTEKVISFNPFMLSTAVHACVALVDLHYRRNDGCS